ncbi:NADH-quinone oxidoreductase subunit C [Desulfosporosinus sp. BICA1-9]|uniref:hydrogenase large subunit n=1 Tax=Desulfosporosinus sp. BICA1-9 TaxID=1531958 RepID=UPI00054C7727|nr:NADH-quinone oxidoreductase subunit C [Desulfosporosinus sp. BICA1-9]KJS50011.1 MAG: formate hydrogenlyase [Peptococcaceae bacterium BRH_c23]KJS89293.1 MAG: formate hydrogenlyase [Desulfosporosinus sp. BICA1-9]HBW38027.1 formate hydrogenlyase [Desulfosporosinus sp.]
MLGLQEYLQSYQGLEIVMWKNQEGIAEMAPSDLPDVLTYCLDIRPRPIWLTHVVNDERQLGRGFCLYLLLHFPGKDFSLTLVGKGIKDQFPTLALIFPALNWSEREAQDLFGLEAVEHPDPRSLVLHPGWPKGFHPLRKDYIVGDERSAFDRAPLVFPEMHGDGIFQVPVGPIHAGIIEPGHFRFYAIGEPVLHLEAQLFYTHKGIEKLVEGRSIEDGLRIIERVCGVCALSHGLAYCEAVEKLANLEVPRSVLLWRTILAELERAYNHIGDIGNMCAGVGFALGNANGSQSKERLQRLNLEFFGHRFLRGVVVPGGMKSIPWALDSQAILNRLIEIADDFEAWIPLLLEHDGFRQRAVTTGILKQENAIEMGVTGPAARASGIANDWRELHAHLLYPHLKVKSMVEQDGDAWSRLMVRVKETRESFRFLNTLLCQAMEGPELDYKPTSIALEQIRPLFPAWGCVESPRGTDVIWLMLDEERKIYRCRVRSASYANWPAVPLTVPGNIVPDFPLINKSFELCYSCCDR